jgi:hypothetical protein
MRDQIWKLGQLVVTAVLLAGVWGCDSTKDTAAIGEQIDRLIENTGRHLETLDDKRQEAEGLATSEVQKLFTFEYKLLPIAEGLGVKSLEATLNELGKDRWDCSQVVSLETERAVLCKRQPKTPLRYIPRILP